MPTDFYKNFTFNNNYNVSYTSGTASSYVINYYYDKDGSPMPVYGNNGLHIALVDPPEPDEPALWELI